MSALQGDELASQLKSGVTLKSKDDVMDASLRLAPEDMQWWRGAKFGMFIHWGLYAIPARGEWVMHAEKIPAGEYAKLADEFVPRNFDADTWAEAARAAGMRYMVLTARHHDGFALWNSPSSYRDFCSAKTAARRDFVAEYVAACRKAGLGVGLYYSPMDWRFPGYFEPLKLADNAALMKQQGYGQVRELITQYGKIDVLWYDGAWLAHKGNDADAAWFWEPLKLNAMVRKYQPKVVINPRSGWTGDFQCDEGGHAIAGPILDRPWEKCLNLNEASWGYNTTFKGNSVYVHVLDWGPRGSVKLPGFDQKIVSFSTLSGEALACKQSNDRIELSVPRKPDDGMPTVVELVLDAPVFAAGIPGEQGWSGSIAREIA